MFLMMMNRNRYIFYFFLIITISTKAQINSDGIVISKNKEDVPHPSAILDVRSNIEGDTIKGMRFPRKTNITGSSYSEIKTCLNTNYGLSVDGLMFYVRGDASKTQAGIYYYNASIDTIGSWQKLRTEEDGAMSLPDGSIIMYHGTLLDSIFDETGKGVIGTDGEGWNICNGLNGTPDLRGKFLYGYDSDTEIGFSDGKSSNGISERYIETHTHGSNSSEVNFSHSHSDRELQEHPHDQRSERGRKDSGAQTTDRRERVDRKMLDLQTGPSDYENGTTGVMDTENLNITLNLPSENGWMSDNVVENSISNLENRPKYKVVVYIMKNRRGVNCKPNTGN